MSTPSPSQNARGLGQSRKRPSTKARSFRTCLSHKKDFMFRKPPRNPRSLLTGEQQRVTLSQILMEDSPGAQQIFETMLLGQQFSYLGHVATEVAQQEAEIMGRLFVTFDLRVEDREIHQGRELELAIASLAESSP